MKIYLDTCCYNRPFDDQTQVKIELESIAKLHIQDQIRKGVYNLVWSFMLDYENKDNPYKEVRENIQKWENIAKYFCDFHDEIIQKSKKLEEKGFKKKDAIHLSCSLFTNCDYFITTDYKFTNKNNLVETIEIINPIDFIKKMEE